MKILSKSKIEQIQEFLNNLEYNLKVTPLIGEGYYSKVFLLDNEIIVKKPLKDSYKYMFENEASMLKKLEENDNIPNLLYYDKKTSIIFMEYIEGTHFSDLLENLQVDNDMIYDVFDKITDVVIKYKIIPTDLHGENILIDKNNKVYLIDLGLYDCDSKIMKIPLPSFIENYDYKIEYLEEDFREYAESKGLMVY